MPIEAEKVDKAPDDDLLYAFDLKRWGLLSTDALASGAVTKGAAWTKETGVSTSADALTVGAATINGTQVRSTISAGAAGVVYRLKIVGTTTAGRDITGFVDLSVEEPPTGVS